MTAISYFTVTGNYQTVGSSAPQTPSITFTPSQNEIASAALDQTILLTPTVAQPDSSGTLSVQLIDNVNLGLPVGALTYRVDYSFPQTGFNETAPQPIPPTRIAAPGNGATVDLDNPGNWLPV